MKTEDREKLQQTHKIIEIEVKEAIQGTPEGIAERLAILIPADMINPRLWVSTQEDYGGYEATVTLSGYVPKTEEDKAQEHQLDEEKKKWELRQLEELAQKHGKKLS